MDFTPNLRTLDRVSTMSQAARGFRQPRGIPRPKILQDAAAPWLAGVSTMAVLARRGVCGGTSNENRHQLAPGGVRGTLAALSPALKRGRRGVHGRDPRHTIRRTVQRPDNHSPELEEHAGDQHDQCQFADLEWPRLHGVHPGGGFKNAGAGRSRSNRPGLAALKRYERPCFAQATSP